MLSQLENALKVASKMAPRCNLTPTWPHLGPQNRPGIPLRSPKRLPRGPQETPWGLQAAPKRPQEAPKKPQEAPTSSWKWAFPVGGVLFFIIPSCVQYVAVRPPPGPRSAGWIRRRPEGGTTGGSPLCQTTLGLNPLRVGLCGASGASRIPPGVTCKLSPGS